MTTEQAIDALYRLRELQDQQHYFSIGREGIRTDFSGIVSVIERLKAENDELKSRMPAPAFSDHQLFGAKPQGRL